MKPFLLINLLIAFVALSLAAVAFLFPSVPLIFFACLFAAMAFAMALSQIFPS